MIIGIDPDIDKSGLVLYCPKTETVKEHGLFTFWQLYSYLNNQTLMGLQHVYIEAGWLNKKSNFRISTKSNIDTSKSVFTGKEAKAVVKAFKDKGMSETINSRISKNVGENHAVGKLIEQMCVYLKIPYTLVRPMSSKWTPNMFYGNTGIKTKSQEIIDAGVLVIGRKIMTTSSVKL